MQECKGNHCGSCCGGSCGGGGCGQTVYITKEELKLLREFSQLPFLPVALSMGKGTPVYLREGETQPSEEVTTAIQMLQQKGWIRVDYSIPLQNYDYAAYSGYLQKGSMALTAKGIDLLEQLEITGIEEE